MHEIASSLVTLAEQAKIFTKMYHPILVGLLVKLRILDTVA